MTVCQFVVVSVRFFAIWLFISALRGLVYLTGVGQADGFEQLGLRVYYGIGFLACAAVVAWMIARPLAGAMLRGVPSQQSEAPSLANLVAAGCVLMGLWWLKDAVVGLADSWVSAQLLAAMNRRSAFASMDLAARARAAYLLAEALAAAVLLMRPWAVTGWVLRRSAAPPSQHRLPEE